MRRAGRGSGVGRCRDTSRPIQRGGGAGGTRHHPSLELQRGWPRVQRREQPTRRWIEGWERRRRRAKTNKVGWCVFAGREGVIGKGDGKQRRRCHPGCWCVWRWSWLCWWRTGVADVPSVVAMCVAEEGDRATFNRAETGGRNVSAVDTTS
jgi:hypothetical protein